MNRTREYASYRRDELTVRGTGSAATSRGRGREDIARGRHGRGAGEFGVRVLYNEMK